MEKVWLKGDGSATCTDEERQVMVADMKELGRLLPWAEGSVEELEEVTRWANRMMQKVRPWEAWERQREKEREEMERMMREIEREIGRRIDG